ncbi:MAG: OmpA family protein [Cytophagales bacterium]|nr:OmpA family protein [Cytophagales bacterium]
MFRLFFSLIVYLILVANLAKAQNATMITVTGKVLSAKDSSEISTSILYEKLPYYDDMGLATANESGDFSFLLIKDVEYNISIRKSNYKALNQEIKVDDPDNNKSHTVNFYLEIDKEEEIIHLNNVIFARGSDILQKESYSELDQLIVRLKTSGDMIIQLEGHTDFAGNPQANMALSQARVESVKKYLVQRINKNRILTKAFGGTKPLFQERTPTAMAKNRRVEVRIIRK